MTVKTGQGREFHVSVETAGVFPVDLLHDASAVSRQRIKSAMNKGAVWLTRGRKTQRLRRAKRALRNGDQLHMYYDERVLAMIPPEPELIADVKGYSVWNKPCGLLSQGSKWGDHCTVVRWAETQLQPNRPAFVVHRLDRAANGLILVAHSKKVAAALSSLFQQRKVTKHYRALVAGEFSSHPEPVRIEQPIDGRHAISVVSFVDYSATENHSLVDVRIETGRKHQIRRHLAAAGHPIIGDRLYGSGGEGGPDLQLTAYLLAFHCPVNDRPVEYRLDG